MSQLRKMSQCDVTQHNTLRLDGNSMPCHMWIYSSYSLHERCGSKYSWQRWQPKHPRAMLNVQPIQERFNFKLSSHRAWRHKDFWVRGSERARRKAEGGKKIVVIGLSTEEN